MVAVNLFSLMCIIAQTIPQVLHVVYDITVDSTPERFSSHHGRNRWSILCLNSKKKKKRNPPTLPHFQICVESKQTTFFLPYWTHDGLGLRSLTCTSVESFSVVIFLINA